MLEMLYMACLMYLLQLMHCKPTANDSYPSTSPVLLNLKETLP